MIKKLSISFVVAASIVAGAFGFSGVRSALAYSPTFNIYSNGVNNGNVTVSVSGAQPNSVVTLYYFTQSNPNQAIVAGTFGTTDYVGNFTAAEPFGNDLQSGVTARYAVVGNDKTNTINAANYAYGNNNGGGYNGTGTNGTITFSNSNPTLVSGQTLSVSLYSNNTNYNYGYSLYTVSSNSNPNVVSASISGSTLQLYGLATGSTSIAVCANGNTYNYGYGNQCGTIFVTVNGGTYGNGNGIGTVTFGQSNVTLTAGQSYSDSLFNSNNNIYNGTLFTIASNSNSNVVSATISGSSLQLYAINAGSASISVCSNSNVYSYGNNSCASVYVTVNGSNYSTGTIVAYPNNPYLSLGQTLNISLSQSTYNGYNYGSNFIVSSNSNPSVVSASISGSTLSVYGLTYGTDVITVCNNNYSNNGGSNTCLPITLTVNTIGSYGGNGNGYGSVGTITFSNANPTLTTGQLMTVTLYANSAYGSASNFYIANTPNQSIVSATISGSTLQLYGNSAGSQSISVCATTSSAITAPACSTLFVTITGSNNNNNGGGQVLGISTYQNGQLIQEGQQISIVYRNTKTPFANFSAFTGLGFQTSNVLNVGITNLAQSSHVVSTAFAAHPWGSWVKNGSTIYFVSEYGLIPVADYQTFIANGGQNAWVVAANNYDMQLPMQSIMVYNDSRLH